MLDANARDSPRPFDAIQFIRDATGNEPLAPLCAIDSGNELTLAQLVWRIYLQL